MSMGIYGFDGFDWGNFDWGQFSPQAPVPEAAGTVQQAPDGRMGGIVMPTQTYTGHTGFKKDGNTNVGIGGGVANPMRSIADIPMAERISARPDLQQGAAPRQLATADPSNFAPVTPITNQASAQSAALRGGV